jgi:DtxR family Mn-dependent transcriptional regulator
MFDPFLTILVTLAAALVLLLLLWPRIGLLWRVLQAARASERIRIEDALKHLHECAYRSMPATLNSLSGALGLSRNRAAALATRLSELRLISVSDGVYELTSEGRSYALRVVRIHRLWERYLSDLTDVSEREWHEIADRREHDTSPAQVRLLAAHTGYPRYDPHGAPIPSAAGDMPPARGIALGRLELGQHAEVVHIEDEPEVVYAQLLAAGLRLGSRVRVLERSAERVRLERDGEVECVLAPVVAANLAVVPRDHLSAPEPRAGGETLAALEPGQGATVTGIATNCRGLARRRLFDLGVLPGSSVHAEMRSPSGDPTAYRVRGALVALRREQAQMIQIERQ